jgi:hypothetical protein
MLQPRLLFDWPELARVTRSVPEGAAASFAKGLSVKSGKAKEE